MLDWQRVLHHPPLEIGGLCSGGGVLPELPEGRLAPGLGPEIAIRDIIQRRNSLPGGFEQVPDVGVYVTLASMDLRKKPHLGI
jgi:hypothetical protein